MVSYLNSKPFILGLELANLLDEIELHLEVPSKTVNKLLAKEVDVALVPVAVLPQLNDYSIFTDYCIGANGKVNSVYLFSDVPVQQLKTIYLDGHSRTSANLLKILCAEYYKIDVEFIEDADVQPELIKGNTACLMIGDKAILHKNKFSFAYDLAEDWKKHTDLPFAFAVWVAKEEVGQQWEEQLNKAFALGLQHVETLVPQYQQHFPNFDIKTYLTKDIDSQYNSDKAKALDLFLSKLQSLKLLNTKNG